MSKRSLYSCILSLAILSVYILLFGFVGEIEGSGTLQYAGTESKTEENAYFSDGEDETQENYYPPPVTRYETSINASNYAKPGFADYPAQTTAPFYYGEVSDSGENEETLSDDYEEQTEITETSATTVATEVTTTTAATTAATTPPTTSSTTVSTTTASTTTSVTTAATTAATVSPDVANIRLTVSNSGNTVTDSAFNIVSKIVQKEIGSSFELEAIKAQAVASYTFVKMYNDKDAVPNVVLASVVSERVANAVREVLGEAVYYNGELIQAVYFASSAGRTASAVNVWGTDIPYLRSIETEFDAVYDPNYGLKKNITKNDMMALIIEKTGINPSGDPSSWLKILNYADEYYVGDMTISGKASYALNGTEIKITGRVLRERIIGLTELKSTAFEFTYDSDREMFVFTTYGYGHGVGLSQNGANILARYEGYDYRQILQFYYPGTEIY